MTSLWFEPEQHRRLPFEPWLVEELRVEALREIDMVPAVPDLAPTLLSLEFGLNGRRLYRDRWERTTATLASARALLEFVRRHPGEELEQRTAYYAREGELGGRRGKLRAGKGRTVGPGFPARREPRGGERGDER